MYRLSFVLAVGLVLSSCGASKEGSKPDAKVSSSTEEMRKYEKDFHPSDYDISADAVLKADKENLQKEKEKQVPADVTPTEQPELVQGYRVQIYASSSIDEATARKTVAEAKFPEQWFYLVYDPPTYKLRVGNFLARYEAERFTSELAAKGFRDAWIVPEKVYKIPPPRPSQAPPKQEGPR